MLLNRVIHFANGNRFHLLSMQNAFEFGNLNRCWSEHHSSIRVDDKVQSISRPNTQMLPDFPGYCRLAFAGQSSRRHYFTLLSFYFLTIGQGKVETIQILSLTISEASPSSVIWVILPGAGSGREKHRAWLASKRLRPERSLNAPHEHCGYRGSRHPGHDRWRTKTRAKDTPPGGDAVHRYLHAGNLDNKELVAGSTLLIPVFVPGALFEIGDGHAAQGDGEVDQTAIETSLRGRIQLTVRKGMKLAWPRAETAADFISMAADPDLTVATRTAIQEMVDFLSSTKGLTRHQAYQLVSVAGNVAVTQLVDKPNLGVHVKMPKSIFKAPGPHVR